MRLKELYDVAVLTSSEVLTEDQDKASFTYSCLMFFSIVAPIIKAKDEDDLLIIAGTNVEIVSQRDYEDYISYKVRPKDDIYDDFELPLVYQSDFIGLCKFVILDVSLQNINKLKNLGVAELPLQNETKESIRNYLNKRYGSISGDLILYD